MTPDEKSAELRDELLSHIRNMAAYWAKLPEYDAATDSTMTTLDRCEGVAHSILCALDGAAMAIPCRFTLTAHVHPDDDDQSLEGVVIDEYLHEFLFRKAQTND